MALNQPELSPPKLGVSFTDAVSYFVSEASVYRLRKAYDLMTSPALIVIKAADAFKDKTTAINQLEAVHHHESRGRHRHAEPCAHSVGLRSGDRAAAAAATLGQRVVLHHRFGSGASRGFFREDDIGGLTRRVSGGVLLGR